MQGILYSFRPFDSPNGWINVYDNPWHSIEKAYVHHSAWQPGNKIYRITPDYHLSKFDKLQDGYSLHVGQGYCALVATSAKKKDLIAYARFNGLIIQRHKVHRSTNND